MQLPSGRVLQMIGMTRIKMRTKILSIILFLSFVVGVCYADHRAVIARKNAGGTCTEVFSCGATGTDQKSVAAASATAYYAFQ